MYPGLAIPRTILVDADHTRESSGHPLRVESQSAWPWLAAQAVWRREARSWVGDGDGYATKMVSKVVG